MSYFKDVKIDDKVFALIFGEGKVINVFANSFYSFEVMFNTGDSVLYTPEGVPSWNSRIDFQTCYYAKDVKMSNINISPVTTVMKHKKILKLRDEKKLEIRCPSGVWISQTKCPYYIIEEYIEKEFYHLFRKIKQK